MGFNSTDKIRLIIFFLLFIFAPVFAFGFQEALGTFITQVEHEAKKVYGDETVRKLHEYKKEVEDKAYETTLKLCEGYRRVRGFGPHPYHGEYMYDLEEAAEVWVHLAYQGAKQPLSAIGGLKADFNEGGQVGPSDFGYWFGSLYTMYLLNSTGFLVGALHCLDMDQDDFFSDRKITRFAKTIVIVDYEMSLVTYVGMVWTSSQVFSLIGKGSRWVFSPVGQMISRLKARIGIKK